VPPVGFTVTVVLVGCFEGAAVVGAAGRGETACIARSEDETSAAEDAADIVTLRMPVRIMSTPGCEKDRTNG
jgi:hypothetical protein